MQELSIEPAEEACKALLRLGTPARSATQSGMPLPEAWETTFERAAAALGACPNSACTIKVDEELRPYLQSLDIAETIIVMARMGDMIMTFPLEQWQEYVRGQAGQNR